MSSKTAKELIRETWGPFFPYSKAKKEEYLEKVRDKVSYYKPKIEDLCSVDLGDIPVKDFKHWTKDYTKDRIRKEHEKFSKEKGRELSKFEKGLISSAVLTASAISKPISWAFLSVWGGEMKHYNSSIYVPFYFSNRFMDIDFKEREKTLDNDIVHEISHKLWYALDGEEQEDKKEIREILKESKDWRLWNEGFASYFADIYFKNLYPEGIEIRNHRDSGIYGRGIRKVEEVIRKQGEEILLEIPTRWKEFHEDTGRSKR